MSGAEEDRSDELAFVVTRKTLRRAGFASAALVVVAGVGIGAYFLGRSQSSRNLATSKVAPPRTATFTMSSTSMWPTLKAGDRIVVNKLSGPVRTGDIIFFKRPASETGRCAGPPVPDLVERVIGLPGQTVSARGGKVYITGKLLKEPWLPKGPQTYTTMNGSYTVPKDDYFVMGDNRVDSCDSRIWGPVKRSYIVGKMAKVLSTPSPPSSTTTTTTTTTTAPAAPPPTTAPVVLPDVERCRATTPTFTTTGPRFQFEPTAIQQTCRIPAGEGIDDVIWSSWTTTEATGSGTWDRSHACPGISTPTPDCPPPEQVGITLSVPVGGPTGTRVFTELVVTQPTGLARSLSSGWGAGES